MRVFKGIKKIELYKFGIISPVLHGSEEKQNQYFDKLAEKGAIIPPGSDNLYFFKRSTFKGWLRKYRRSGMDGLKEKTRCDKGKNRKIDPGLSEHIRKVREEWQLKTAKSIWRKLIELRYIGEDQLSYESLRRFILKNRLLTREIKARKKFEKQYPNELWMADFKHGKAIRRGRGFQKVHLCAIIDDSTRIAVGYEWGFHEDTALFSRALQKAVSVYGIPGILYCDCGKVFQSQYALEVCGRLGIALVNTAPYSPESKGKIEKFNLTVAQLFYPMVKNFRDLQLDELNQLFDRFVKDVYHQREHGGIRESPLAKFHRLLQQTQIRRVDDETLNLAFHCSIKRRVRNDATILIHNVFYEIDVRYIGDLVEIRFPLGQPDQMYLYENGSMVQKLRPVNLVENANPPYLSDTFSKLIEKKGDH